MQIIASITIPKEQFSKLEERITASVLKCLNGTLKPPQSDPPDIIGIDEAVELTKWSKATIYKKSFTGEIPCSRMGKRLIFSRKELLLFMQSQTIRKQSAEEKAIKHLQKEANNKRKS